MAFMYDCYNSYSLIISLTDMAFPEKTNTHTHLQSSACSSQDHNRSTVKRMYSSVFSMIDNDQDISHFSQADQQSRIALLLSNPELMAKLQSKLRSAGVLEGYNLPVLRVSLLVQANYGMLREKAELDQLDMESTMQRFGDVHLVSVTLDKKDAYVFFNSMLQAYICYKLVNQATLRGGAELRADWVHHQACHPEIASQMHSFINSLRYPAAQDAEEHNYPSRQNKFTCRYDIQIQNQKEFQVARRIIGSKGCNMKRIIEESICLEAKSYSNDSANELLKLRLRGKGSGYKQGPEQQESSENLHLCVSAKDENVYGQACEKVQKLLTAIYSEYYEFTRKQGRALQLSVKKILIGQSPHSEQSSGKVEEQSFYREAEGDMYRIGAQKIEELLEMRNKARRELNFSEADKIRNYLRSCGVCLIDEKGRRGRATEVTTWKYLY